MTTDESTYAEPSEDDGDTRSQGRARAEVRRRRWRRRRRLIALGVLLVVVVVGVALAVNVRSLVSAKHEAQAAQRDLTSAKDALSQGHVRQARASITRARAHVDRAQGDAGGLGGDMWSVVPVAGGAVDDERHLIDALDETTSVAELGVEVYPIVSGGSAQLVKGQRIDMKLLQEVADHTTAIGPHLDRAMSDLAQVDGSTPIVGSSIVRAKTTALNYLTPLQDTYQTSGPVIRSLPALLGADGPRTYLLAMLNPAELRYSGGAALSFTTMRFDDGVATFGTSVNAEDLNGRGSIQSWPPVTGNLFHRRPAQRIVNSTFSPWWSVSGEELLRGYRKAFPGPRFNGMIGIDLQGLANLFKITGPIDMPTFGRITADNLVKTLGGSYAEFNSQEQRHRLNAELVPAFRQQFFEGGQMSKKVKSLVTSAEGRHFVAYFRNRAVERGFAAMGVAGNLSRTPYDYLGVFSQNINGSKNDYWQHREVTSTVRLQPDGSARADVHVTVTNGAPAYDLPVPDPGIGYTTKYLGARIGVFLPRRMTDLVTRVDDKRVDLRAHRPTVATVTDRKYVETPFLLNHGESGTIDLSYRMEHAADVLDSHAMTYHLDVDPQDLVSPEVLHVTVIWPPGYHRDGALPDGWKATKTGATFQGVINKVMAWEIPLTTG